MCIFSRWSTYNETQIDEKARLSSAPISFLFFGLTSRESDPSRGIQKNLSFLKMRRGWTWWGRHSHPYLPKVFMLSKVSGRLTPAVSGKKRPKGIKKVTLEVWFKTDQKGFAGVGYVVWLPGMLATMAISDMMIHGALSDSLLWEKDVLGDSWVVRKSSSPSKRWGAMRLGWPWTSDGPLPSPGPSGW